MKQHPSKALVSLPKCKKSSTKTMTDLVYKRKRREADEKIYIRTFQFFVSQHANCYYKR